LFFAVFAALIPLDGCFYLNGTTITGLSRGFFMNPDKELETTAAEKTGRRKKGLFVLLAALIYRRRTWLLDRFSAAEKEHGKDGWQR